MIVHVQLDSARGFHYSGDRTHVTPPDGGTPTTTISDARGRTVELRQYHGATPTGSYDATSYSYTPGGQLAAVTDPAGNQWRYTYDLRGRKVEQSDPDSGVTRFVYDVLDRLVSTTDARGVTLHHSYDPLGRKLATREGSASGPLLTSWVYDTVRKGQLTSATRHVEGQEYTTRITNYDRLYRPIRTYVIVPEREGLLAGYYQFNTSYRLDGLLSGTGFPAAGGMVAEGVTYTYDSEDLGRPVKLTGSGDVSYVTDTRYSYTGQLMQLALSTGGPATHVTNSYEYGTKRLATSRVERVGVAGVDRHATYSYDDAGNIESVSDVSRSGTDTQCFAYDYLRRLTEAWTQDTTSCAAAPATDLIGGPAPYWHSYAYDKVGNRCIGYVLGVACDHRVPTRAGVHQADALAARLPRRAWQRVSAGQGAKGHRFYDWAWVELHAPDVPGCHWLLIRRNRRRVPY